MIATASKEVVLLGAGHTHLHVLRHWRQRGPAGAHLTCVSNFDAAAYSGMLSGVLAGQYAPEAMQIALEPLCRAANATLIVDEISAVDLTHRHLALSDGRRVPFDLLSVGVGSIASLGDVRFAAGAPVVSIKPMQTFLERLRICLGRIDTSGGNATVRLVVVGGGAAGVEVALCVAPFAIANGRGDVRLERTLVTSATLVGDGTGVARRARRALEGAGVRILEGRRVVAVEAGRVVLDDDTDVAADVVLWTTAAAPAPILKRLDLPTDAAGFLLTTSRLQSTGNDRVFAVGDCGSLVSTPTAKAGVYAVRQGPILLENLRRAVNGDAGRAFSPQGQFLRLLNTGDGRAIGEWRGLSFEGRWCWYLKDAIDRRFVERYRMTGPNGRAVL